VGVKLAVTTNYSISKPQMKELNLVNDCFPEPPTPINKSFDPGINKTRQIRVICSIAC